MRVTDRAAPYPGLFGPDRRGHRGWAEVCRKAWGASGGHPDTHQVVSFVKDHDRPLQVDAVCPATLQKGGKKQGWYWAGKPPPLTGPLEARQGG